MFEVQARPFRSARSWHELADKIDMEPEYQRSGGIWSDADQSLLIDSMINDYDLPKLYVVDFTTLSSPLNSEKKRYAVVDGKQRLEAIFKFFSGELRLQKGSAWLERPEVDIVGLAYDDIQTFYPDLAAKISEFPLPVMHIVTDEVDRIKELFVRLNRGASLTGAEKRNAMIGPLPKIIRNISRHKFFEEHVRYPAKRGQNLNAAAKLLRFELARKPVDTKKRQLDEMVAGYENYRDEDIASAAGRVTARLDEMCNVFKVSDPLLRSQGTVPVYYLFVGEAKGAPSAVRDFLVAFEAMLRSTRKNSAERPADLVAYDNAMRSTNDGWSHDLRLTVLTKWFRSRLTSARSQTPLL